MINITISLLNVFLRARVVSALLFISQRGRELKSVKRLLTAVGIFREAVLELTDGFEMSELEALKNTVINNPNIAEVKSLKARTHGNQTFVDIVIVIDQKLNVFESHRITEEIEKSLMDKHHIQNVHIHIEPK